MKNSSILQAIFFAFFLTACSEPTNKTQGSDGESLIQKQDNSVNGPAPEMVDTMSESSFTGTYSGELPCADCEAIKTSLSLQGDRTFVLNMEYLGSEASDIQVVGTYNYNEQSQVITLENAADGPSKFLYENGKIWQLDQNEDKIKGDLADRYVLTKEIK